MTRIIIDTNVIISLEEDQLLSEPLARLVALLQANSVQLLVHPASIITVYTQKDIEDICERGESLVILFRLQGHLPRAVTAVELEELGIKGPFQTIRTISNEQFKNIAKLGRIEGRIPSD